MSKEEIMSRSLPFRFFSAIALTVALTGIPAFAADTFTGKVSDTMCGETHNEKIDPAECVRACVKHGGQYALVSGGRVYTLNTADPALLGKLSDLAWKNAKVTGTADGNNIAVESVAAAK
jgi:hypothetical protein